MSLCDDIIFLCRDRVLAKARMFLVATIYCWSQQTLAKKKRVFPRDKVFCVVTGCGQDQGALCCDKAIRVMIELG